MNDGSVEIWGINPKIKRAFIKSVYSPFGVRLSASGINEIAVCGTWSGKITSFSTTNGDILWSKKYNRGLDKVIISYDGRFCFCLYDSYKLLKLDIQTGEIISSLDSISNIDVCSSAVLLFLNNNTITINFHDKAQMMINVSYKAIQFATVVGKYLIVSEVGGGLDVFSLSSQEIVKKIVSEIGFIPSHGEQSSMSEYLFCIKNIPNPAGMIRELICIDVKFGNYKKITDLNSKTFFSWNGLSLATINEEEMAVVRISKLRLDFMDRL